MKRYHLLLLAGTVAFAAGGALGYGLFRSETSTPSPVLSIPPGSAETDKASRIPLSGVTGIERSDQPSGDSAYSGKPPIEIADAIQRVLQESNPYRRLRAVDEFCVQLTAGGAKAALDYLLRQKAARPGKDLIDPIISRWAEIDPEAAANYAAGMSSERIWAVYSVMPIWAAKDPEAAMTWALKATHHEVRQYSINSVVTRLAERDPKAALRMLDRMPRGEDKIFYYSCIFDEVARRSPEQAAELAATVNSSLVRHKAAEKIAIAWGQSDPAAALDWLAENNAGDSDTGMGSGDKDSVLTNWVDRDPEAAAEYVANMPGGRTREESLPVIAKAWAAKDPEAAAMWIDSLPKGPMSNAALNALVSTWAEEDPTAVAEYLQARPRNAADDEVLGTFAHSWVKSDAESAWQWARQQNDPMIEQTVAAEAIGALALKNRPEAIDYLSQLKSTAARERAIGTYAHGIRGNEPASALAWLQSLPSELPTYAAVKSEIQGWAWRDPKAVAQWLEQQTESKFRDTAVDSFAQQTASDDALAAAAWAKTISDTQLRSKRLNQVIDTWAQRDGEAARNWVLQQGFSADVRQGLLGRIGSKRSK